MGATVRGGIFPLHGERLKESRNTLMTKRAQDHDRTNKSLVPQPSHDWSSWVALAVGGSTKAPPGSYK
jgi:hypothetical protein